MACEKYCKGMKQTKRGPVTIDLDPELHKKSRFVKLSGWLCPLGCLYDPKTEKAANNLIANGGGHHICMNNKYRGMLFAG